MASNVAKEAIASQVEEIIKEHIGVDEPISPDTNLQDDLAVDSLERVELGIKLEKAFGIKLTNEAIRAVTTMGDFIDLAALEVGLQKGEENRV